jgi:hypothetical protein
MKKSKFTEVQIAFALQKAETGTSFEEVCRKMGILQILSPGSKTNISTKCKSSGRLRAIIVKYLRFCSY